MRQGWVWRDSKTEWVSIQRLSFNMGKRKPGGGLVLELRCEGFRAPPSAKECPSAQVVPSGCLRLKNLPPALSQQNSLLSSAKYPMESSRSGVRFTIYK